MSRKEIVIKVPTRAFALGTLLTVLFVGLKLTGYVAWPWLWVVSPLWIPFALSLVLLIIALAGMGFITFLAWLFNR